MYIQTKEDAYDEDGDVNPAALMQMAATKYKIMVDKGVWNAPTPEDENIIALTVQIQKLQAKRGDIHKGKHKKRDNYKEERSKQSKRHAWKKNKPTEEEKKTSKEHGGKHTGGAPTTTCGPCIP